MQFTTMKPVLIPLAAIAFLTAPATLRAQSAPPPAAPAPSAPPPHTPAPERIEHAQHSWTLEISVLDPSRDDHVVVSQQLLVINNRANQLDCQGTPTGVEIRLRTQATAVDDGSVMVELDYREGATAERIYWAGTFYLRPGARSEQRMQVEGGGARVVRVAILR